MVKAAPLQDPALEGLARVVREGTIRRYITEDPAGVLVPLTGYYARKLAAGELVQVLPRPKMPGRDTAAIRALVLDPAIDEDAVDAIIAIEGEEEPTR
jgi:hypothetical protein